MNRNTKLLVAPSLRDKLAELANSVLLYTKTTSLFVIESPPMVQDDGVVIATVKTEPELEGSVNTTDKAAESTLAAAWPAIRLPKLKATELIVLALVSFQAGAARIVPVTWRLKSRSVANKEFAVENDKNSKADVIFLDKEIVMVTPFKFEM